jgi:3-methyladenine DNA glycosylase/8-oxoguanine DNA glycosylase
MVELREEVTPRWTFRLPARGGADGVTRFRGGVLHRLLHVGGEAVVVRVAQPARDRVVFGAKAKDDANAARAIERMRFALSIDDDLRDFYDRFRDDPLIGPSVRARPHLRCSRRPAPFEALAWAICEQLIDFPRAAAIERRIVRKLGRSCARSGLVDLPTAETLGETSPALLQSLDLSHGRALALVKVAREVACGRADLDSSDHESAWRRLRAIPGIGSWTLSVLAQSGQGRYDVMLAGDLGFIKLVGRLRNGGDPHARATERDVLDFFKPYGEWAGLASIHALRV